MINWEKTSLEDGKNNTAWYTKIADNEFEVYIDINDDTVIWKLNILPKCIHGNEKKEVYSFTSEINAKQYVEKLYKVQPKIGDKVERKWGYYEILEIGENYQVKKLVFNPGGALSYQKHFKRKEVWTLVQGQGTFKTERFSQSLMDWYNQDLLYTTAKKYLYQTQGVAHGIVQPYEVPMCIGDIRKIDIEQMHKFTAGPNGATIIETWLGICDEYDIERVQE